MILAENYFYWLISLKKRIFFLVVVNTTCNKKILYHKSGQVELSEYKRIIILLKCHFLYSQQKKNNKCQFKSLSGSKLF